MLYADKDLHVSVHRSPKGDLVLREDVQGKYNAGNAKELASDVAAYAKKHRIPLSGDFYSPHPGGYPTDGKAPVGWQFCLLRSVCKRKADGRKFSKPTLAMLPERPEGTGGSSTKVL